MTVDEEVSLHRFVLHWIGGGLLMGDGHGKCHAGPSVVNVDANGSRPWEDISTLIWSRKDRSLEIVDGFVLPSARL